MPSGKVQSDPCTDDFGEPCDKTRERTRWYGWQTLTVDGMSLALALAGAGSDLPALEGIAVFGYAAGPPIVHFAHGRVGAGFGSLGLRVALPLLGGAVGASTANCHDEEMFCGVDQAAIGILIGTAAAIGIDAAVLARETVTEEGPVPMRTLRLTPVVDPYRHMAQINVAGAF